jgi:hypothetical protein
VKSHGNAGFLQRVCGVLSAERRKSRSLQPDVRTAAEQILLMLAREVALRSAILTGSAVMTAAEGGLEITRSKFFCSSATGRVV